MEMMEALAEQGSSHHAEHEDSMMFHQGAQVLQSFCADLKIRTDSAAFSFFGGNGFPSPLRTFGSKS